MPDHALIVRGGTMSAENILANVALVAKAFGRPGLCVMVALNGGCRQIRDTTLVPNKNVCLSARPLLREHRIDELGATNDLGNPYQFTLWLPAHAADEDTLKLLWSAFRGPVRKRELADELSLDDLRGLQHPGS